MNLSDTTSHRTGLWAVLAGLALIAAAAATPASASPDSHALAQARVTGERVAVAAEATEVRKVFANPDGTFTAKLFSQPVQVRRDGGWVPVDTDLARRPDGSIAPRAIAGSLVLSGGGSRAPLARFAVRGQSIELGWPGTLPEPTLKDDTAIYRDVRRGVDLRVRATPTGFAPLLVVKRRAAAARVERVSLEQRLDAGGDELAIDVGDAGMWDGDDSAPVAARSDGESVTLVPDAAFLESPDTAYPLSIVPPDYQRPIWESGWAKVMSGNPNTTYWLGGGDGGEAKVGYCGWAGCNGIGAVRSYFQYDHQGFLFGKNIISAQLNALNIYSPSCSARWVDFWQTEPIGPGTTWNNQPWASRVFYGNRFVAYGYSSACPANWIGFDVTNSVRGRVGQGWNAFTYALSAGAEFSDAYGWKKFAWNPSLVVHYNTPPRVDSEQAEGRPCAVEPNEPYTTTTGPKLRARVTDPDGGLVQAHFQWFVRWHPEQVVGERVTAEAATGSTFEVDIPDDHFKDGDKIAFRVRGYDGRDWSNFGRWCDITVDRTKPAFQPTVTSTDYPEGQESGAPGVSGRFTFARNPQDTDVTGFRYSLENSPPDQFVAATTGTVTIPLTPENGSEFLFVQSVDKAGNLGPIRTYGFLVGLPTAPAGHWRLDGHQPSTSAPDASGGGREGTLTGGTWTTGRVRDAVRLNGDTGHVRTTGGPPVRTNDNFTVAAWVRIDANQANWRTVVSIDGNRVSGFFLQWNRDVGWSFVMPHADVDSSGGDRVNAPAKVGRWTHLAGVHDAGAREIRLYVDGRLAGRTARTSAWAAGGSLQIGRAKWNGAAVDPFPGTIDDVKVYQRALPQREVAWLATRPAVSEGRWMLDEESGTMAADASGNFQHATATPGTSWVPGPARGAVQLDGVTGSLGTTGPVVRTDGSFTVSTWVKADRFQSGIMRTAVSQEGTEKSAFLLGYRGDTGRWSLLMPGVDVGSGNHALVASSVTPQTGEWTHLAGVHDLAAGELRIYVNGALTGTSPLPANWSPWHASGPLRIGRAKWSGRETDHWPGAIDEVHVYTGVRTDEEILDEFLSTPPAPTTVYAGSVGRYVNHDGEHLTAAGPIPRGYRLEGAFGLLAPPDAPGTWTLYTCKYGNDTFTSWRANCEGYPRLGEVGRVYAAPQPGVPLRPLYRCVMTASGEHFEAVSQDCEGQTYEGPLGYVRAYVPLVGHVQADPPGDRRTSVFPMPATYEPRERLGVISLVDGEGMRAIYGCQDGVDAFTSLDSGCDGKQVLGRLGSVWTEPPPDLEAIPLSRCRAAVSGERYDAPSEDCGADMTDGFLGYAVKTL